jgi:hypothetical protein
MGSERLQAESESRIRAVAEDAARRIAAESHSRIRDAVDQAAADLAHQAERMERAADRLAWIRAGTVALATLGGAAGGAVAVLILRRIGRRSRWSSWSARWRSGGPGVVRGGRRTDQEAHPSSFGRAGWLVNQSWRSRPGR